MENPAITPIHELPQELLQELSALGIDPNSLPEPDAVFVGISSAVGAGPEDQAEIDAWIAAGGMPEFDES